MRTRRPIFQSVHYDKSANALWDACGEYLRQAEDALRATPFEPPVLPEDVLVTLPLSAIKTIRTKGKDHFDLGWPFAAIKIEDAAHPGERTERYFDQWYFVAMQLFGLAGCRLALRNSKLVRGEPRRWYAEYQGQHQLRRIIAGTPAGRDTRQRHPTAKPSPDGRTDAHYDYRRITFRPTPKPKVRAQGQLTRSKSKTREDAVLFATDLLGRQHDHHAQAGMAPPSFSASDFQQRLRTALAIADDMHERFAKEWPGPAG